MQLLATRRNEAQSYAMLSILANLGQFQRKPYNYKNDYTPRNLTLLENDLKKKDILIINK
jgi:hypothetical protein